MRTASAIRILCLLTTTAEAQQTLPPQPALPAPLSQAPCADARTPEVFFQWNSPIENLAFDGRGGLFITPNLPTRLIRLTPQGTAAVVFGGDPAVLGITLGSDCHLYAGATPGIAGGVGPWQVWKIDDATPGSFSYQIYAEGLPVEVNGMAFDPAGNLYVSTNWYAGNNSPPGLIKIPVEDPSAWDEFRAQWGANGLFDDGSGGLLVAIPYDQSSPILRIPYVDPSQVAILANLSFGALTTEPALHQPSDPTLPLVPKGLDDLALGPDGMIYVAAHVTGEVLRVDPISRSACVFASGFHEPSSVRFAHHFGAFDGDLFVTDLGSLPLTTLFTGMGQGAVYRIDMPTLGSVPGARDCTL